MALTQTQVQYGCAPIEVNALGKIARFFEHLMLLRASTMPSFFLQHLLLLLLLLPLMQEHAGLCPNNAQD